MTTHEQKYFIFYLDNMEMLEPLSNEQLGQLMRLIADYAKTMTLRSADDPAVDMAYRFMSAQIRRDFEKYEEKCRINAENGRKGGRPKRQENAADTPSEETEKTEGFYEKPKKANTKTNTNTNTNTNTKREEKEEEKYKDAPPPEGAFSSPALADVKAYAESIGGCTSPERFHSFYESNGWVNSSGQPVCDWKAAYRYWTERDKLSTPVPSPAPYIPKKNVIPESPMAEAYKSLVYNIVE